MKKDPIQIQGTTPPDNANPFGLVILGVFMLPLIAIGGVCVQMAIESGARDGEFGKFEFGLCVIGLFFFGLWFYVLWYVGYWRPTVTVTRFALNGDQLEIHLARDRFDVSIGDVLKVRKILISRRGHEPIPRHLGWWIRLRHQGWILLPKINSQGAELAHYLKSRLTQ